LNPNAALLGSRCAGEMFPCHGATTANARLLGVPAVSRHGFPARPSVLRPAFLSLRSPALHPEKKSLTMRGTLLSSFWGDCTIVNKCRSLRGCGLGLVPEPYHDRGFAFLYLHKCDWVNASGILVGYWTAFD
jgi:hypothetical protein